MKLNVYKLNNTHLQVECDDDISLELNAHFSEFAEGYKFHPLFKQRRWDGRIHFWSNRNRTLPVGMLGELIEFCMKYGYSPNLSKEVKDSFTSDYSKEEFAKEFLPIPVHAYGEKIQLRDYQLLGVYDAIKNKRKLFSSNTSSGKSAIQYGIIRLLQNRIESKILLIVPATSLVEQMYSDFRDYATLDEDWYVEDNCARLYADYRYDNSKNVLISTWQSLQSRVKDDPEFFEQFGAVLTDEAHQAKAAIIGKIMEACVNAEYRLAFTGTVPKDRCNKLTIIGHFGPIKVLQTSKQAMDKGYIAKLSINCLVMKYSDEVSKAIAKMNYQEEMDALCKLDIRNEFICETARNLKGNTLVITNRVEKHGKVLHRMLVENPGNKQIHYIFGEVDVAERERIRVILETRDDVIVVGNSQILSTGWSVRNLHNLISAFPSKSFTRTVQTIGRSLRKHESKDEARLFDISDCCNEKNYSWQHFLERVKIYSEEQFSYNVREINLSEKIKHPDQNSVFEA